jgi:ionotropic glutamate receptor
MLVQHEKDDLTRAIIELQKKRFFEDLTAKYWNSSLKGDCANSDDSEGISLESLGGVFIATIFGLCEFHSPLLSVICFYMFLSILDIQNSDCHARACRRSLLL